MSSYAGFGLQQWENPETMSRYRKLTTACLAAALALGLAACGGGGSSTTAPPGGGTPPTPTPKTGSVGSIPQTTGIAVAVATSETRTIAAGGMAYIGGVKFSCAAGDTGCDLTLTKDSDGTVTGAWSGAAVTAEFVDPLENMNEANEAKIAAMIRRPTDAAPVTADPTADPPVVGQPAGVSDNATLGMLKDTGATGTGKLGAANIDKVTLTDDAFDPNATGEMLNAGMYGANEDKTDDIGTDMAGALGLMGWSHKVLHADWGDTAGGLDAGIETAALIYSNMAAPAAVAFEDVAGMVAARDPNGDGNLEDGLHHWFAFTVRIDGVDIDDDNPAHAVNIADAGATSAAAQAANAKISPSGQGLDALVVTRANNDTLQGTYFGAAGTFKCVGAECQISRETTGTTPYTLSDGQWQFKPDADETVTLPDQDWLAFGVWLTAPDNNVDGYHHIGVFYDGMEAYANADTLVAGTAKFTGKAAGYYVNGTMHGLFTADASLTATFGNTDTLSGTIQNFRDSQGRYIDSDNPNTPNDPNQGGENDWGINLESTNLNANGTFGAPGGNTSGTADGVTWNGTWMAQLYGPGGRAANSEVPPTGVAGNFRAITNELTGGGYKGVVGGFGGDRTNWTPAN